MPHYDFCTLHAHHGMNTLHRKCNGFLPNKFLYHQSAACQVVTTIMSVRLVIIGLIFRNAEMHSLKSGENMEDGKGLTFSRKTGPLI